MPFFNDSFRDDNVTEMIYGKDVDGNDVDEDGPEDCTETDALTMPGGGHAID